MDNDDRTYAIIGAAMEVHRVLGVGFLEAVYQGALAAEFGWRRIPFETQVEIPVCYRGHRLECYYRVDFVCFQSVMVELKAVSGLASERSAQLLNYLKASGSSTGLLLNFGSLSLETKRLIA